MKIDEEEEEKEPRAAERKKININKIINTVCWSCTDTIKHSRKQNAATARSRDRQTAHGA